MAQYLPVLLVSVSAVSAPAPDDSSLDTQAIGQVDYLSHDWQEEDVARSWRNMTRRKDSIQNGARLENASWRTWWKQRNNLPTVSPETLNWLKDSDVTWLYGPLHTANDWAPPPRQPQSASTAQASIDAQTKPRNHSPTTSRSNSPWGLKPILKHRSISELLSISFPNTPSSDALELPTEGYFTERSMLSSQRTQSHDSSQAPSRRPRLTHTKSDTNVHRRNPFRGDSPPLPLIPEKSTLGVPRRSNSLTVAASASSSSSPGSQDGASSGAESSASNQQQKRHISFNTFVEQCIAIEKPQGYDEEDEEEEEEYYDETGYREDDEDSNEEYDSEEDVLEMKSSRRNSLRSNEPSLSGLDLIHPPEREHVTIAPIAPTILKTSASPSPVYGSNPYGWSEEDEDELFRVGSVSGSRTHTHSPPEADIEASPVPLVFVPPQGSVYAERLGVNGARAFGGYPYGRRSRSSSSSPGGSFDDADAYSASGRGSGSDGNDVDVEHDEGEGYPVVSSEVVYEPYRGPGPGRIVGDEASSMSTSTGSLGSEVRSTDSKGGSSEGEGTIVPAGAGGPSSLASSSGSIASTSGESGSGSGSQVDTTATSKPIPVPHVAGHSPTRHHHAHQSPSPAPSAGSTSTSTTSSNHSPLLDVDSRGRSTSPITSVSPSGDSSRGRSMRRGSSDRLKVEKDEREPPRGRSRSRSIGGADGSVSPRSGLSRKESTEGIGIGSLGGYGGSGYSCGPRERKERDVSSSLSPDDGERRNGRIGRVAVGRNVGYGRRVSSDDGSSSMSPPARETPPRTNSYTLRASNTKPIDIPLNVPVSAPAASPVSPPVNVLPPAVSPRAAAATTSVAPSSPVSSTATTPTSSGTPTPTITSGTATPTSTSASTIVIPAPAVISTPPTPPSISKPSTPTVGVTPSSPVAISTPNVGPPVQEASLMGRAMSSAKGYLGAFWGNGQAQTAAR